MGFAGAMRKPRGRVADEQLLRMLQLRAGGLSSGAIAERMNIAPEGVRIATNRVRDADLAESGEPAELVMQHYPWGRK